LFFINEQQLALQFRYLDFYIVWWLWHWKILSIVASFATVEHFRHFFLK